MHAATLAYIFPNIEYNMKYSEMTNWKFKNIVLSWQHLNVPAKFSIFYMFLYKPANSWKIRTFSYSRMNFRNIYCTSICYSAFCVFWFNAKFNLKRFVKSVWNVLHSTIKTTFAVNIISSNCSVISVPTSNQFVLLYILSFFLKLNRII
jgi:hypothetical protein